MDYRLIRSNRKTFSMEIRPEGLVVRAPNGATAAQIEDFVERHRQWAQKRMRHMEPEQPLTQEELRLIAQRAADCIPGRVAHYAPLVGVTYGRITIRAQRTRWGSCSARGNLNFNCLLMLAPPEVLDSVVVHELCHRKEMNHSQGFYREVERVFPEYGKWHSWLKENGMKLLCRLSANEV